MTFEGFPSISKATAIPNSFFANVLPLLTAPDELLAFLWVSHAVQAQQGDVRFVTADEILALPGAEQSFANLASGREGFEAGLEACVSLGVLLAVELTGPAGAIRVFFVNNPGSRRAIARARAGEISLHAGTFARPVEPESRPTIFRLYEEHVGTITPMVGERLVTASETYPEQWIEDAFRRAAEANVRNWKYIERILARWAEEGRADETPGRDTFEERKQRFTGGDLGRVVRYR
ncbi:hypothetical protein AYO38_00070 [bacterium SCGC AG-212-C10]|nr:hypothetical protein AYO38_00070 [bacterium SCGC AG-212-C10]